MCLRFAWISPSPDRVISLITAPSGTPRGRTLSSSLEAVGSLQRDNDILKLKLQAASIRLCFMHKLCCNVLDECGYSSEGVKDRIRRRRRRASQLIPSSGVTTRGSEREASTLNLLLLGFRISVVEGCIRRESYLSHTLHYS